MFNVPVNEIKLVYSRTALWQSEELRSDFGHWTWSLNLL